MQLALRASLAAACVPAGVRLGFDRARARELQWLFTNARIEPKTRQHVQDSFFGFTAALGIAMRSMRWTYRSARRPSITQREPSRPESPR
jgi:heptosyltransferase I